MHLTRRQFHRSVTASAFAGLAAAAGSPARARGAATMAGYGPLVPDPAGLLDLPKGFSYRIISALGDMMDDGEPVPDAADGMGAFAGGGGRVILVRNHEIKPAPSSLGGSAFDRWRGGGALMGGTTTLVYDPASGRVERQYRSLAGTIRNCAGGITPWRTWLSCEENVSRADGNLAKDHGWVFEVPADLVGRAAPVPLKALGRFYHEAAVVDPATGIVYLTEDWSDGLFYRFLPDVPGQLARGGRLQALGAVDGRDSARNWSERQFARGRPARVRWIDLDGVESPDDDLRQRGYAKGALLFARGEGIWMGRGELYFTCTTGGAAKLGQVFRYRPSTRDGGMLELFFETEEAAQLSFGDNIVIAPNGDVLVCEDRPGEPVDNHIRGIGPDGSAYDSARLRVQTETAGACFSPDGRILFVNVYSPTKTLAITGPWAASG